MLLILPSPSFCLVAFAPSFCSGPLLCLVGRRWVELAALVKGDSDVALPPVAVLRAQKELLVRRSRGLCDVDFFEEKLFVMNVLR